MNDYRWSNHRVSSTRAQSTVSRRDRDDARRQQRARVHLARIRGQARPRAPIAIAAPVALLVSVAAGALFGSPFVAAARSWIAGEPVLLEAISIRGADRLTLPEIAESTGLSPGATLDSIDSREIEQQLSAHPWIADASAVRLPTGRLLLRVTERVPRAVVTVAKEGKSFAVDASGTPFALAETRDLSTLPKLILSGDIVKNEPDARLARAVALAYRLPEFNLPIPSELIIAPESDPDGITLRIPNLNPRVVVGHDDFDARLAKLARLLEANPAEVARAAFLDLRFADQAVLRGTSPPQGATQAAAARGRASSSKARPAG
jgi:cell division protein FtsQ